MTIDQKALVWIELVVLTGLLLTYGWSTYQRNFIWKDEISLWSDVVKKSPGKARPYIWIGLGYQRERSVDKAILQYKKALSLNPSPADAADAHNNLGLCYFDKGLLKEAIWEFEHVIKILPSYMPAHNNLGFLYIQMKEYEKALNEFNAILKVDPHNEMAKNLVYFCKREINRLE